MNNNVINFSDLGSLKRYENKSAIYTNEKDEVIVVYGKGNIEKVIAEIEKPVLVYSPNVELKIAIINVFIKNMTIGEDGNVAFNVKSSIMISELLSRMTNIDLGLDSEENKQMVEDIISDPSDLLIAVNDIMTDISKNVMTRWSGSMIELQNMPIEQREIYIKEVERQSIQDKKLSEPVISEKEKRKIELQKQLEELDKEDENNEGIKEVEIIK